MSYKNIGLKSLFIHVPKCAGCSMSSDNWNRGSGHDSLQRFFDKDPGVLDYYKWAFVRNPWDRLVSAHVRCTGRIQPIDPKWNDFKTFLKAWHKNKKQIINLNNLNWSSLPQIKDFKGSLKVHFFPMRPLLTIDGEIKMDFIGRFENIMDDWAIVCKQFNVADTLIKTNTRKNPIPYQEYYDKDTRDMVHELFLEDINTFNYKF